MNLKKGCYYLIFYEVITFILKNFKYRKIMISIYLKPLIYYSTSSDLAEAIPNKIQKTGVTIGRFKFTNACTL